jgi:hypothetical protein
MESTPKRTAPPERNKTDAAERCTAQAISESPGSPVARPYAVGAVGGLPALRS